MNYNRYTIRALLVIVALLCMLVTWAMAEQQMYQGKPIVEGIWDGEPTEYVGGEIMVMFYDANVDAESIARSINGTVKQGVEPDGFALIEMDVDADVPALCEQLYGDPRVRFAEPNFIATMGEWNPNDPYYSNGTQWSLRNTGQDLPDGVPDADINVNWAWDYNHGATNVVLAILDSGIDMDTSNMTLRHSDLNEAGKIILGPDYIGDGYGVADLNGHGTHVAGIASAETNNSVGIAGVAEYCDILVIQVFSAAGSGSYTALRNGINYAVSYQTSTRKVIMNYSGGGSSGSSIVDVALANAETNDVPFVTISHNDGSSTCRYPCRQSSVYDCIICVGSTDPWDVKAGYSNYCNDVNVVAPGGYGGSNEDDIYSCLPPNTYSYKAGTSMAAPHVAGICGIVRAANFNIGAEVIRDIIEETADDEVGPLSTDPQGYDNRYGYGRANAWSAIIHSPTYVTPYMRLNQRMSNTFSTPSEDIFYRLDATSPMKWEVVATRPHAGVDVNCRWIDTDGITSLSFSGYGGEVVDFVCASNRPTSGSDMYARIYNWSGTGKYSAEYEKASGSYIGSMYLDDYEWESSHVVQLYQLYLQDGHRYTFEVDMSSGEADLGIALMDRPAGSAAYYTGRSLSEFLIDATGSGGDEGHSYTITTGDGWYAFVIYNNNGRNGVMDIKVEERLYGITPVVLSGYNNVTVMDGYYYHYMSTGNTMAVIGVSPLSTYNYNMYLYSNDTYSGTPLASSTYATGYEDWVLVDRAGISSGYKYPKVDYYSGTAAGGGNTVLSEVTDEWLYLGSNGPYTFDDENFIRAWDVNLTSGYEYNITGDITSGSLDIGIGLYRQDATYKSRGNYFAYDYTGGVGVDEEITWTCDSTGYYTLVAWSRNGLTGNFNIDIDHDPNLAPVVFAGWDYEFVPRSTGGALFSNCPITATLPGNTNNTNFNFGMRNVSGNSVPAITFYDQLYLDGVNHYQVSWSTGMTPGYGWVVMNQTTSAVIRGGKHTIDFRVDGTNTITEHDETDNNVARQFIWSPYLLSSDVAVVRDSPPDWSTLFPQPNADGFRYPKPPGYAYGVGIISTTGEDVNIRGYNDYIGSEVGYDSLVVSSMYGSQIDFFVGTYTGVDAVIYPAVYTWYGSGTGDYVIHASNAQAGQFYTLPDTVRDTLVANEILNVYEGYFMQDSSYTLRLENVSGTANLGLAIFGPDYGYYNRGQYVAWSNTAGPDEEITYVPTSTSWHVIAVFKNYYTDVPLANVYDLIVMKTPPNLATVVPTGWSYEFVPRNVAGATSGNCLITATLPGNSTGTYLNFCGENDSPIGVPNDPDFYDQLYLDGTYFFQRPWAGSVPPGFQFKHINWPSTAPIRGGRHTIELRLDGTDIIVETDETDNDVSRQFVWSPLSLVNGVSVIRVVPPPGDFTFPYPNTDGFEYTRTSGVAYGVAICELDATEDFDLRVYDDYTGSESGFSNLVSGSYYVDGYTDYVVATYTGVSATVYPGVYDWETTGIDDYVIEGVDASGGRVLDPNVDVTRRDTLVAYEMIHVYEALLNAGSEYTITVDNISGTADLALALYGPSNGYYSRSSYAAYSNNVGPDEEITYTPASSAWFVITVFKPSTSELLPQNIYDLSITLPEPNLTYVDSPTGWDFPVVPRNAAGADTGNVVLTATLPGNTNNTYFNYHAYNEGPTTVTDTYWNYIFIDSTSWYGASMFTTQPALTYAWFINRQSSNTVRGGRHTVGVSIDRWDDIGETDETDNWVERQFVWSPYLLTNYVPVGRDMPPPWGNGTYMNCDGFEFTTSWWGAVGIIAHNITADYNLRLHDPWVNSQTGFDLTLDGSGWGPGRSDFIIASDLVGGSQTLDIGVVRDLTGPAIGDFHIEQANQQVTWVTPGTYGPYTLGSFDVLGVWEVRVSPGSQYDFEVDVISGNADIGTSIYGAGDGYYDKSEYVTGGFSNSAGPGGDESFTVPAPGAYYYYGWVVWKESSVDLTLSSTFYLTWGPVGAPVPMPVDDLVIQRIDTTGARLIWSQVTQDTSGNPLAVDYYRIHRNIDPGFTPSTLDSIGFTTAPDTTYDDVGVVWSNDKYFYQVIAVDTDGVVASQPGGEERGRIITGDPEREETPEAIRSRQRR